MFHRPIAAHRLFFAIRPPLVLARQIADAASWFDPPGQPLRPEHLHVTLDILDDRDSVSGAFETVLKEVGDAVGAAPFAIAFDMAVAARDRSRSGPGAGARASRRCAAGSSRRGRRPGSPNARTIASRRT